MGIYGGEVKGDVLISIFHFTASTEAIWNKTRRCKYICNVHSTCMDICVTNYRLSVLMFCLLHTE